METQVAPSQQLAATQSQKPTTQTQPYDPANDPTVQVEADADEASEGEEEVRRAISALPPSSIARRGFSQPPRATPGAARDARARLFPRTAVPFLTLFPLSPGSTTTVRAAPAVVPLHRGAPELRHIHDGHQGARLGAGHAPLARASTRAASPPRARPKPDAFFLSARRRARSELLRKIQSPLFSRLAAPDAHASASSRDSAPALVRVIFHRRNAAKAASPRSSPC